MATIVGGIATSHTPTIGFALDTEQAEGPGVGADLRGLQARAAVARGQEARRAVLHLQRSRHLVLLRSLLALRARRRRPSTGSRTKAAARASSPPIKGHPGLAQHVATGLVADEFDLSYFQGKGLDHGCFSPLSLLWPHDPTWPGAIVPLQVGVLEFPIPSARRCFKLGQSLRKAIESYPEDIKVAIVGTGGLSHQVHGERAGFNNTPWDMEFLDLLEKDPEKLTDITIAEYAERGGCEGSEVVMWLIMRGALSKKVKKLHQAYYLPSMTPIATRDPTRTTPDESRTNPCPQYRERIGKQLGGHREARRHLSVHARSQREGVSAERLPAPADRARDIASGSSRIRSRCSRRRGSPRKSATWSAGATGAR